MTDQESDNYERKYRFLEVSPSRYLITGSHFDIWYSPNGFQSNTITMMRDQIPELIEKLKSLQPEGKDNG